MFGIGESTGANSLVYDTVHLESQKERRTRYIGYWLMCVRTSSAYIALALTIPQTWPYLRHLQPEAEKTTAAWIVSGMFIARIANNGLLGPVLRVMSLRTLSLLTSVMVMLSYILWASAELVPSAAVPLLALSRVLDGLFGSDTVIGSLYVTRATTQKERGPAMALLAGAAAAAYVPGAGLMALLSLIGSEGANVGGFPLNMYTTGGLSAFTVFLVTTVALYFSFYDNDIAHREQELGLADDGLLRSKRSPDSANYLGIVICILAMCAVANILLFNDSMLVTLLMEMNGWPDYEAVRVYGFLMIGFSIVSTLMFIVTARISNRVGESRLLLIGAAVALMGFLVALPWGSERPPRFPSSSNESSSLGCPPAQTWCDTVPRVHLAQMAMEVLIHGVAVALLASTCNSLFSRCLPRSTEGFWWGLMKALANVSRLSTPVAFAYIYHYSGPRVMYAVLAAAAATVLTTAAVGFRRLSDRRSPKQEEETPLIGGGQKTCFPESDSNLRHAPACYGSSAVNGCETGVSLSSSDEEEVEDNEDQLADAIMGEQHTN